MAVAFFLALFVAPVLGVGTGSADKAAIQEAVKQGLVEALPILLEEGRNKIEASFARSLWNGPPHSLPWSLSSL